MNKNKVKKSIEYKSINSILKTSTFVGFFCVQNMSVKDKLSLKDFKWFWFYFKKSSEIKVKLNILSTKICSFNNLTLVVFKKSNSDRPLAIKIFP